MIIRKLELGPFAANCYIVGSESTREGMIIDPGTMPEEILNNVEELGLKIKIIVLTHHHMDHVGALAAVKEATGAEVAIHADDARHLRGGGPMAQLFGLSREAPTPDRLLKEGDVIDIGELHFQVLHTPGHSPGGICLLEKDEGVVFSGDTLFQFSIGRTDFPGGSHEGLIKNIKDKLMVLPDNTTVYTGHGPDTTIGIERRVNPFL
ncbi:MAG TPA: MBL fold metallo-hydrolase [Dehalococcoidia bacterium]|nr:MBL fold metallo-hydrolase [Dehalococcoidia bacterium]